MVFSYALVDLNSRNAGRTRSKTFERTPAPRFLNNVENAIFSAFPLASMVKKLGEASPRRRSRSVSSSAKPTIFIAAFLTMAETASDNLSIHSDLDRSSVSSMMDLTDDIADRSDSRSISFNRTTLLRTSSPSFTNGTMASRYRVLICSYDLNTSPKRENSGTTALLKMFFCNTFRSALSNEQ